MGGQSPPKIIYNHNLTSPLFEPWSDVILIVKRYPNRKLYDTESKQYITLEGIANLIRQGREVQVIEHGSGEDVTTVILTQIILEQERKQSGFLPLSVLAELVRARGRTLGILQRSLASPLELFRQIDEEIERRLQVLISRGELAETEALRLRDQLLAQYPSFSEGHWIDEEDMKAALARLGAPSRQDLRILEEQIEALSAKLDELGP